jgi:hypothetical protein
MAHAEDVCSGRREPAVASSHTNGNYNGQRRPPGVCAGIRAYPRVCELPEGRTCGGLHRRFAAASACVTWSSGGIVPDPARIITGGHDNQTARTVAIYENEVINGPALAAMFGEIIANNRAGGWRKLKPGRDDR